MPSLETAWRDVDSSFERFCLPAGIGAIEQMLCEDAQRLSARRIAGVGAVSATAGAGPGNLGFHGGKVAVHHPRVRSYDGHEMVRPTWTAAQPRTGLAVGDEPEADQRIDAQTQTRGCPTAICRRSPVTAPRSRPLRAGS